MMSPKRNLALLRFRAPKQIQNLEILDGEVGGVKVYGWGRPRWIRTRILRMWLILVEGLGSGADRNAPEDISFSTPCRVEGLAKLSGGAPRLLSSRRGWV